MIFRNFFSFLLITFFFLPQTALSKKTPTLKELKAQAKTEEAKAKSEEAKAQTEKTKAQVERTKAAAEREAFSNSQKTNVQAKGIIITFKVWPPPEKDKTALLEKLKKAGLTKDTEIKRFKIWVYQWPKVQTGIKAEKLCKDISGFSSIASCSPDHIANPEYDPVESAERRVERARQSVENAKEGVENAKQGLESARQGLENAEQSVENAREMVQTAEQMVQSAEQNLQTAREGGNSSEIESAEEWLEGRKDWLEERKNWLEGRESWLEGRKNWLESRKSWLESRENWLESSESWLESSESWLETVKSREEPDDPPEPPEPEQPDPVEPDPVDLDDDSDESEEEVNLRSCNILTSEYGLNQYTSLPHRSGALSDYWAQEMIGADLLKEELEGAAPVSKKLVELFDRGDHGDAVKNLISGEGKQAVMPDLGDSIGVSESHRISDFLRHSDDLLRKVDDVCGVAPDIATDIAPDVAPDQDEGTQVER